MADYWWDGYPYEKYWVEIRKRPGIGTELRCPLLNEGGTKSGWYELLDVVKPGDVVYHWHATQSMFVGRSIVDGPREIVENERVIPLRDFTPLLGAITLADVRAAEDPIYDIRDALGQQHPSSTLYLPFQFRSDGLRMASYYFGKLPLSLVEHFFGTSGFADQGSAAPPPEEGEDEPTDVDAIQRYYLEPFKPKADQEYVTKVKGGVYRRGRKHETLVNEFSNYLVARGLVPGRNRAVDIGLQDPPVIVEAEVIGTSWPRSIREAVGQLYEYRYLHVASPDAGVIFLASKPIPEFWVTYLQEDRGIAVAWRDGDDFVLSAEARGLLGLGGE